VFDIKHNIIGVRGVTFDEVTLTHCWTLRLWIQKISHRGPSRLYQNDYRNSRFVLCTHVMQNVVSFLWI